MIKNFLVFAKWRPKDVNYLNSLKLDRTVEEGYFGFIIEEGEKLNEIRDHFSKNIRFIKSKPKEFSITFQFTSFSKQELDDAEYYMLAATGIPKGYPLPKESYVDKVFRINECNNLRINKEQISSFRIQKPRWSKNQLNFTLHWEWDCLFFKRSFYQEELKPLGLNYIDVYNHESGKILKDTIQLNIPISKSKIMIKDSPYDMYPLDKTCGSKQYSTKYLDFFPPFEKSFDFHICYTQEEFYGGFRRVIITKEFSKILLKHNIIKYDSSHLIPMKK